MTYILLVEPNTILARQYKTALESAGHKVVRVSRAQTAIHTIDKRRPDVLVLELQLGKHNGLECLYEIRSYPEWDDLPIVVLSDVPESELEPAVAYKQLHITRYVPKSTKLVAVVEAIEEVALAQPKMSK